MVLFLDAKLIVKCFKGNCEDCIKRKNGKIICRKLGMEEPVFTDDGKGVVVFVKTNNARAYCRKYERYER